MPINFDHCRSMQISSSQMPWSGIDRQWSVLSGISEQCGAFDWHWSALGIDRGSPGKSKAWPVQVQDMRVTEFAASPLTDLSKGASHTKKSDLQDIWQKKKLFICRRHITGSLCKFSYSLKRLHCWSKLLSQPGERYLSEVLCNVAPKWPEETRQQTRLRLGFKE